MQIDITNDGMSYEQGMRNHIRGHVIRKARPLSDEQRRQLLTILQQIL